MEASVIWRKKEDGCLRWDEQKYSCIVCRLQESQSIHCRLFYDYFMPPHSPYLYCSIWKSKKTEASAWVAGKEEGSYVLNKQRTWAHWYFLKKTPQDHEHYLTFPNHFSMMKYIIELLLPNFLICPDFLTISYYLAVSDLWKTCYLYVFRAGRFVRWIKPGA